MLEQLKEIASRIPNGEMLLRTWEDFGTIDYRPCQARAEEFQRLRGAYAALDEEYQDIEILTAHYLAKGSTVLELFHDNVGDLPCFILSKIGPNGRLIIASSEANTEDLACGFVRAYEKRQEGFMRFVENVDFIRRVGEFARVGNSGELIGRFNLEVHKLRVPPLPKNIKPVSVDAVINECGGWDYNSDADTRDILAEIDTILKPGGVIITGEPAREQARLEYLMGEVRVGYSTERLEKLSNPYFWMILRKPK